MEFDTYSEQTFRARSKTPFLRSSCDRELCQHLGEDHVHHEKKVKKIPQIQTIMEEEIPEMVLRAKSTSPTKQEKVTITTKQSADDSLIRSTSNKNTITTTTITTRKTTSSSSGGENSTVSKSFSSRLFDYMSPNGRSKEASQNEINSAFESSTHIKTSTPIGGASQKNVKFTSPAATDNGQSGDHISYEEYKAAGEYWNKFPKTDYTYSRLSPHRREVAPGIVAMPNMSRKSLDKHHERITYMIQQNPAQEAYIRRRYESTRYAKNKAGQIKFAETAYDSQDEVDQYERYAYAQRYAYDIRNESFVKRTLTWIVSIFSWFTSFFQRSEMHDYYARNEKRGLISRTVTTITSAIVTAFRPLYFLISSALYVDTLLLRSSNPNNNSKKRFLVLLLLLLPLLLLAAWNLIDDEERLALTHRMNNLIPIAWSDRVRNLLTAKWSKALEFDFKLLILPILSLVPFRSQQQYTTIESELPRSLGSDDYKTLLNHIDNYVQKLVDEKMANERRQSVERETKLSKELTALIEQTVRANVIANINRAEFQATKTTAYQLTDSDIARIVAAVLHQVETIDFASKPLQSLSKDGLDEITRLIKYNIDVNNQNLNIIERIDMDAVIAGLLQSPKLAEFVTGKIQFNVEHDAAERQLLVDRLHNDILLLTSRLETNEAENQALHQSIVSLQANYADLSKHFGDFQDGIDGRIDRILSEMNSTIHTLHERHQATIDRRIKLTLINIMGYKNGKNIDEADLQEWLRKMFVAKDYLEERLSAFGVNMNQQFKDELSRSELLLMKDITEKLKLEILKIIESRENKLLATIHTSKSGGSGLSEKEIRGIVRDVLAIYDADKTGLVDYALETAGGQVLSTRCTENYHTKSAQISIFGIPLWYPTNTPRTAISPSVRPGECWAFQGFPGFLVLKLNTIVFVTGFTLEHIPKMLSPFGTIDSAPRNFTVWAFREENDPEPQQFGEYEYVDNDVALQYFPVQNRAIRDRYDIVEVRIESNHGNKDYTCLYRFRVHGTPYQIT